jgi:hypothetical protein
MYARDAAHHLRNALVDGSRFSIQKPQQLDFFDIIETRRRIIYRVKISRTDSVGYLHATTSLRSSNSTSRLNSIIQSSGIELIRVSEACTFAGHRPNTDTLIDAVNAVFHDPVFDAPALESRKLKVNISVGKLPRHERGHRLVDLSQIQSHWLQQLSVDRGQRSLGGGYMCLRSHI